SIEKCIVERALHDQEILNRLKRLNDKKLQIQECKLQEVKGADASSRDTNNSGSVSDNGNAHIWKKVADSRVQASARLGIIKAQRNKAPHLGMTDVGQGMNAMIEAILGMIWISDLPMTHNQWLRYHILLNIMCLLLKLNILSNLNFVFTHP
ncbi:hypothetical protein Tco_0165496, partial [Tanacetum coccineum]